VSLGIRDLTLAMPLHFHQLSLPDVFQHYVAAMPAPQVCYVQLAAMIGYYNLFTPLEDVLLLQVGAELIHGWISNAVCVDEGRGGTGLLHHHFRFQHEI
jgi:uncharacterized membrane protein